MNQGDTGSKETSAGFFEATIWSTVLKAKADQSELRQLALDRLVTRYRRPIFRHIEATLPLHRRGEAEDLSQAFILQCLRLDFLKKVSPEHGRFRTFIKRCIQNFLRDEHVRACAEKRGGGQAVESLDETDGEGNHLHDPPALSTAPELALDREWALSVLENSLNSLERECVCARRGDLFTALKGHLGRAPEAGTAKEIGERLGMNEGTVHVAMNRMRGRLGELIQEEIKQTVGNQEDWRQELKYLVELLGR